MKHAVQTLLLLVSAVLLLAGAMGLDDHSEEWDVSQTIMAAQDAAIAEAEKQRIAQVFCSATAGEAVPVFDADGEFTCKARRIK